MYNKSEIFKRAHYLFRTCKSLYKTFGEALSDVWQSAIKNVNRTKERDLQLKIHRESVRPTIAKQPNLSEYYNQPSGTYLGD